MEPSTMPSALPYVLAAAFLAPGILALLIRDPRRSRIVGFGGGAVASFLGLVVTLVGAMGGAPMRIPLPARVPWAPSPVSAASSGVTIKTGIYGTVRFLFYLPPSPPASFGAILLAPGLLWGVF